MIGVHAILPVILHVILLFNHCSALPLCTDLSSPQVSKSPLAFCPYNGTVCCDSAKDLDLQKQFQAMNVSDSDCASLLKSILCATCDQYSEELFNLQSGHRQVPILCNSNTSSKPNSFCSTVWDTCQNVPMLNSPFAPTQNSTSSKLTDFSQSKSDFCNAFGGKSNDGLICFDGEQLSLNDTKTSDPPKGLCFEKISNNSYINMVAHPDGSNRAFFSNQAGKIWLASVPEQGSGNTLDLDESDPFIDLSDQVFYEASFGMMGVAFHPKFTQNGRFFVSFNCDKDASAQCSGRCSCNSDVNCDPSKIGSSSGEDQPCRYHSVIAEYTANGSSSEPSLAKSAKPLEVRRIFTMGLVSKENHGGQILFGPDDGYLYFTSGDGGIKGDPYNFAQNKKSLLGKILRLDIDNIPSATEIEDLSLWGNYSTPKDNPYSEDKDLQPEIWALGFRNPWRCSFDDERPSYFICTDVGENQYEEVDMITRGGNYGWNVYEGPIPYKSTTSSTNSTSSNVTNLIFPIMGYAHADVNNKSGSAAIIGGCFYRSMTDPCMYGRYLYADLYAGFIWAAEETPINSGKFTTNSIPFSCSRDSPIECNYVPPNTLPALGYIFSFEEDNRKDVIILSSSGVYRVVPPSRCSYSCSKENITTGSTTPSPNPSSSLGSTTIYSYGNVMLFLCSLLIFRGYIL